MGIGSFEAFKVLSLQKFVVNDGGGVDILWDGLCGFCFCEIILR